MFGLRSLSRPYWIGRNDLMDAAVVLDLKRERAKAALRLSDRYEEWKRSVWVGFRRDG